MKKIYFLALSLFVGAGAMAQTVGNLDLENWTGMEPDSWTTYDTGSSSWVPGTYNYLTGFGEPQTTFEETTNPSGGTGAARLETAQATPGGAWESNVGTSEIPGLLQQQADYTVRPTDFIYDVFATPQTGDTSVVQVVFYNATQDVIGYSQAFYSQAHTAWESKVEAITWLNADTPAEFIISVVSSTGDTYTVGSEIMVDNFDFVIPNPAPNVTNVVATDIADNGNGTDLQVTFDVPADESNIANYYLAVSTPDITPGLIEAAGQDPLAFFQANGIQITPNGNNVTHVFSASDIYFYIDGTNLASAPIEEDVALVVWVYVEGAGGFDDVYNGSNEETLTSPTASLLNITAENIRVFPNPASETINFDFGTKAVETVTISNVTGEVVKVITPSNTQATVNVSNLENGVYFYNATDNAGNIVTSNKFVVSH